MNNGAKLFVLIHVLILSWLSQHDTILFIYTYFDKNLVRLSYKSDDSSERKNISLIMAVMPQMRSAVPGHANAGML